MTEAKSSSGQSLVEIVFMVGISFLVLTGLVAGVVFTLKAAKFAENKAVATRLAREKIEEFKSEKQSQAFWDSLPHPSSEEWVCYSEEEIGNFTRRVYFNDYSDFGGELRVVVRVETGWLGGDQNKVSLSTILTNWED